MKNKSHILLSAFGIHSGGGLVLLKALATALNKDLKFATLDARLCNEIIFNNLDDRINYVKKNFFTRFMSLYHLSSYADSSDILFCFNSLPPIFRPRCRVITYVHAPHFANMHLGSQYTLLTTLRIWIERQWFKFGVKNCSELWVQTLTMAETLRLQHPSIIVRVIPFVDDDLANRLSKIDMPQNEAKCDLTKFAFFYPADAVGHKNHVNLLKAWKILKNDGFYPRLLLTLTEEEVNYISAHAGVKLESIDNIENLGRISRSDVLIHMKVSSAMIFPSLAETFGLPMLEARALGVPIVASERDFVRDVCIPVDTFDPNSPSSIARAVKRFMGVYEQSPQMLNASQFVASVLKKDMQ